ncbi:MAG: hypothetical protein ACFFCS_19115 [Candidatus Hodarchaeota archaeon]
MKVKDYLFGKTGELNINAPLASKIKLVEWLDTPENFNVSSSSSNSQVSLSKREIVEILKKGKEIFKFMEITRKTKRFLTINKNFKKILAKWVGVCPGFIQNSRDKKISALDSYLSLDELEDAFHVSQEELLNELLQKGSVSKDDLSIYLKVTQYKKSAHDIMKETWLFESINEVYKIIDKIKGALSDLIGEKYETWLEPRLGKRFDGVKHDGRSGFPDFECFTKDGKKAFISVKCLEFAKKIYSNYKDHQAEINAARKYYSDTGIISLVNVHIYNRYTCMAHELTIPEYFITQKLPFHFN